MKLLLNGRFFARPVTGVERLAIELTRAIRILLRAQNLPDVDVAVPSGLGRSAHLSALGDPLPVVRTVGRRSGHSWEQTELPGAAPEAWLLSLCNVGPMLRKRQAVVICDAQFVLHPESYSRMFRWWYRMLLTVLSRRAGAVFTISEFSRDALERYGIVPRGKVHVLKLGVDHLERVQADVGALARYGLTPRRYLLAIGSLARHKNLAMLVDAYLAADLTDLPLIVAGGGNARVFRAAGLKEGASLRYIGRVSDEELKTLYAGALAFACPSLSEGFGFTPLEAMQAGCPVIATNRGAVPEVCGEAALYADPHDLAAWTLALRRVATDSDLRYKLAAMAKAQAAKFRWADTARQMLDVLDRLD